MNWKYYTNDIITTVYKFIEGERICVMINGKRYERTVKRDKYSNELYVSINNRRIWEKMARYIDLHNDWIHGEF